MHKAIKRGDIYRRDKSTRVHHKKVLSWEHNFPLRLQFEQI